MLAYSHRSRRCRENLAQKPEPEQEFRMAKQYVVIGAQVGRKSFQATQQETIVDWANWRELKIVWEGEKEESADEEQLLCDFRL